MLEDVLDGLFEIAKADGVLHPGELAFLERVAEIFGFAPGEFRRIRASHFGPDAADPYVILGVDHEASDEEVRRTYRLLVRENHPDRLIARGVPEEFVRHGERQARLHQRRLRENPPRAAIARALTRETGPSISR